LNIPWITHPVLLQCKNIELRPLQFDMLDELFAVSQDPEIWRLTSVDYSLAENFYPSFSTALKGRDTGKCYPFVICLADSGQIIGTTRLLEIAQEDRKLEIGVTWLNSRYWGSGANTLCKYLLLEYCFEMLCANRVQFRAKAENARSRRALEKIGAVFEGILRKDKIEPGGQARNTAFFSILGDEWPALKPRLATMF
jgi:RimJ/RimL family protein N-acetyltransferase